MSRTADPALATYTADVHAALRAAGVPVHRLILDPACPADPDVEVVIDLGTIGDLDVWLLWSPDGWSWSAQAGPTTDDQYGTFDDLGGYADPVRVADTARELLDAVGADAR